MENMQVGQSSSTISVLCSLCRAELPVLREQVLKCREHMERYHSITVPQELERAVKLSVKDMDIRESKERSGSLDESFGAKLTELQMKMPRMIWNIVNEVEDSQNNNPKGVKKLAMVEYILEKEVNEETGEPEPSLAATDKQGHKMGTAREEVKTNVLQIMNKSVTETEIASSKQKQRTLEKIEIHDKETYHKRMDTSIVSDKQKSEGSLKNRKKAKNENRRILNKLKPLACLEPGCRKRFANPFLLKHHVRAVHQLQKLTCPEKGCGEEFLYPSGLRFHRAIVHNIGKTQDCDMHNCGKKFDSKRALEDHGRVHHGNHKLKCNVLGCPQLFNYLWDLKRHMEKTHL